MDKDICKICGQELKISDLFCPVCGFEHHILPSPISKEVQKYEENREEKYMVRWEEHKTQEKLKEEKKKLSDDLKQVKDELEETKQALRKVETDFYNQKANMSKAPQPLAFLVQMSGERVTAIYDINEGENSFGYTVSQGNHHQIICEVAVADKHFIINAKTTTSQNGNQKTAFTVVPCDGKIYGAKGGANIISTEENLEKNSSIYVDDIKFTLVANNH